MVLSWSWCWLVFVGYCTLCRAYPVLTSSDINSFSDGQKGIEHNHSYVVMVTEDL